MSDFVSAIHRSGTRLVLAVSGGGATAIADLLATPGASNSVLEAVVPYSEPAMNDWLAGKPDHYCSEATARAMAMSAFLRAGRLGDDSERRAGIAATASLASDRPKRGPHRVHVAFQTAEETSVASLELLKGQRSRAEEERLASDMVLNAVAEVAGLAQRLPLSLFPGETPQSHRVMALADWRRLLLGEITAVRHKAPGPAPRAVFPGAFHPLHRGHRQMMALAETILGAAVEPEIAILNVDKPPLDYLEIADRTEQFDRPVWLTRAATFDEKSALFPSATFIVGADTLRRIAEVRYYGDVAARQAALRRIAERGCRFLVFGRAERGAFVAPESMDLPTPLRDICRFVPEESFRMDISSTELRE